MKNTNSSNLQIQQLWPTFVLTNRLEGHLAVNASLVELFHQQRKRSGAGRSNSYASNDKLLETYDNHLELQKLAKFVKDNVFEIASYANRKYWKEKDQINLTLTGMWFQISNQHAFHETHVHGNCSWSGVYYVQSGDYGNTPNQKNTTRHNGITRFYGPYMDSSGGGHSEYGNIYLQDYAWNSYPEDGKLIVFPSYLKHMAYPYSGEEDRIVISFHAQIDNANGFEFRYDMNN